MILLIALLTPAFTNLKSAGDVTSAAYTIKGVLEQARTYAMANNTYTWVGFAGSVGTPVTGQVSIATLASNDGTVKVCQGGDGTDSTNQTSMVVGTGPGAVTQLGKLVHLDNSHVGDTGDTDERRYRIREQTPCECKLQNRGCRNCL